MAKRKSHKCPTCKTVYECTADECDQHYYLQCTPCENKEYDEITNIIKNTDSRILNGLFKVFLEKIVDKTRSVGVFCVEDEHENEFTHGVFIKDDIPKIIKEMIKER